MGEGGCRKGFLEPFLWGGSRVVGSGSNIGALTIRIGFGGSLLPL